MIKNVFFIQNLVRLNYFLTLYQPHEENLLIINNDNSLNRFFHQTFSHTKIITIPPIPNQDFRNYRQNRWKLLMDCFSFRVHYTQILKAVAPKANVYFFAKAGQTQFFILLGYLFKQGMNLNYVDRCEKNKLSNVSNNHLRLVDRLFLFLLSWICGIQLIWTRKYTGKIHLLGWGQKVEELSLVPDDWEKFAHYFQISSAGNNKILWVDGPMQSMKGLDPAQTQAKFIAFLQSLLEEGVQIDLKPHPDYPHLHSLQGTEIEKKINLLPSYFPIELLMSNYEKVYIMCNHSNTLHAPFQGEKYSLSNLLVFQSAQQYQRYQELCERNQAGKVTNLKYV